MDLKLSNNEHEITSPETCDRQLAQPIRSLRRRTPICPVGIAQMHGRRNQSAMDPEYAIREWIKFTVAARHPGIALHRTYDSDLELVTAMEAEQFNPARQL